jgi:hypothetical protein
MPVLQVPALSDKNPSLMHDQVPLGLVMAG